MVIFEDFSGFSQVYLTKVHDQCDFNVSLGGIE